MPFRGPSRTPLGILRIKQELKIGCLFIVEAFQELMSMTHSMVDSKRSEES